MTANQPGAGSRDVGIHRFDITNRTALVTGSSRGLGYALARALLEGGARVAIHGRNESRVRESAERLAGETGGVTRPAMFDVTDTKAVDQGVADLESAWGTPDILVNNAGLQRRAPLTEFSDQDWHDLVGTNLTSTFLMSRRVARGMIERGTGKIINIGSVQSQLARPSIAAYSATKGGVVMLTKGLCADLAPFGIQVNAIAPGYFATQLTQALVDDEEFSAWVRARTPAGRWGQGEDLAGALLYLASDASAFVNGQTLYVDGGMTAVI
jgi:gluconate 5-dehydrogenase